MGDMWTYKTQITDDALIREKKLAFWTNEPSIQNNEQVIERLSSNQQKVSKSQLHGLWKNKGSGNRQCAEHYGPIFRIFRDLIGDDMIREVVQSSKVGIRLFKHEFCDHFSELQLNAGSDELTQVAIFFSVLKSMKDDILDKLPVLLPFHYHQNSLISGTVTLEESKGKFHCNQSHHTRSDWECLICFDKS